MADDAVRLALGFDRCRTRELERSASGPGCALTDEDLTPSRCLLEPCADVDRVTTHEGPALVRRADDDIPRVHTDSEAKPIAEQVLQLALHRKRRVKGAFWVILLRRWRAKGGHDSITCELLHRSAYMLDLASHRLVEALEHYARTLRILGAGKLGRSHQIGKQDRRELALRAR